jgi:heme exporter protein D
MTMSPLSPDIEVIPASINLILALQQRTPILQSIPPQLRPRQRLLKFIILPIQRIFRSTSRAKHLLISKPIQSPRRLDDLSAIEILQRTTEIIRVPGGVEQVLRLWIDGVTKPCCEDAALAVLEVVALVVETVAQAAAETREC